MKKILSTFLLVAGISLAADTPIYHLRLDGDANGSKSAFTNLNSVSATTGNFERVEAKTIEKDGSPVISQSDGGLTNNQSGLITLGGVGVLTGQVVCVSLRIGTNDCVAYLSTFQIPPATTNTYYLPAYGGTFAMFEDLELVTMRAKVGEVDGIEKARAVYFATGSGGNPIVKKSSCGDYSTLPVIGVTLNSGAFNDFVDVALFGPVSGFDTDMFAEGEDIFLGENGLLDKPPPDPTCALIYMGKCTKKSVNNGKFSLFIRPYFQDGGYNGSLRYTVKNSDNLDHSTANFYALNDLNRVAHMGVHGSGHFKGPAVIFRGSYGKIVYGNSTKNSFVWCIDMTDSGLDFPLWDWPLMALVPQSGVASNAFLGVGTTNPVEMLDVTANGLIRSTLTIRQTTYLNRSKYIPPRWVDEKFSGLAIAVGGTAPQIVPVAPGSNINGMGFDTTDYGYFTLQWQHGLTDTNAVFPNLYYIPHIHLSAPSLTPPATNVTFVIQYRISRLGGSFAGTDIYKTNTIGLVSAESPVLLPFGHITNNVLSGADSVMVQGLIRRIPSTSDDFGAARIIVDSLDFHIPMDAMGSMNDTGGDQ